MRKVLSDGSVIEIPDNFSSLMNIDIYSKDVDALPSYFMIIKISGDWVAFGDVVRLDTNHVDNRLRDEIGDIFVKVFEKEITEIHKRQIIIDTADKLISSGAFKSELSHEDNIRMIFSDLNNLLHHIFRSNFEEISNCSVFEELQKTSPNKYEKEWSTCEHLSNLYNRAKDQKLYPINDTR